MSADAPGATAGHGHNIGTQTESSLHSALKLRVSQPGDRFEVLMGGFVVDVVRGDTLIEIQTGGFAAMGRKLDHLLGDHHVHIVHPIAVDSWIERFDKPRRKSPKHGCLHDIFGELVSVPTLLDHPNLTIEVFLVQVDVVKVADPAMRRRRGGWRTVDRRLLDVVAQHGLRTPDDLAAMLPERLPGEWTTRDLAEQAAIPRRTAQQMAYVLKANELVTEVRRDRAGAHYVTPGLPGAS
ncbi:MAG: hypothetical protein U5K30_06005 [Acidimicrobiales bacterium]|nr:hypothetical protein [Acidimicrobiales bacterium]